VMNGGPMGSGCDYENGDNPRYLLEKTYREGINVFIMGDDVVVTLVSYIDGVYKAVLIALDTKACDLSLTTPELKGCVTAELNYTKIPNLSENAARYFLRMATRDTTGSFFLSGNCYTRDHGQLSGGGATMMNNFRVVSSRLWMSLEQCGTLTDNQFTGFFDEEVFKTHMSSFATMKLFTIKHIQTEQFIQLRDFMYTHFDWISHRFGFDEVDNENIITFSPSEYKLIGGCYAHRYSNKWDKDTLKKAIRFMGLAFQFPELKALYTYCRYMFTTYYNHLKRNYDSPTQRDELIAMLSTEFPGIDPVIVEEWVLIVVNFKGIPPRDEVLKYKYFKLVPEVTLAEEILITVPVAVPQSTWAKELEEEELLDFIKADFVSPIYTPKVVQINTQVVRNEDDELLGMIAYQETPTVHVPKVDPLELEKLERKERKLKKQKKQRDLEEAVADDFTPFAKAKKVKSKVVTPAVEVESKKWLVKAEGMTKEQLKAKQQASITGQNTSTSNPSSQTETRTTTSVPVLNDEQWAEEQSTRRDLAATTIGSLNPQLKFALGATNMAIVRTKISELLISNNQYIKLPENWLTSEIIRGMIAHNLKFSKTAAREVRTAVDRLAEEVGIEEAIERLDKAFSTVGRLVSIIPHQHSNMHKFHSNIKEHYASSSDSDG